jgi:hypothetical protein
MPVELEMEQKVRLEARSRVAQGFDEAEMIVDDVCDFFAEEIPEDELGPLVRRLTEEAIRDHLAEQQSWPVPTDCDRLDRAFAALERAGIVARQNFTCCQTCGHAEIADELDASSIGYTFYHMQDTENAVLGDGVCLAYGAVEATEEAAVDVGHRVVAALRREGLAVSWDGSADRRIVVTLDWKRRRRL